MSNANNVIELKKQETQEIIMDSDYFGPEKVVVNDLMSLVELVKKVKDHGNN